MGVNIHRKKKHLGKEIAAMGYGKFNFIRDIYNDANQISKKYFFLRDNKRKEVGDERIRRFQEICKQSEGGLQVFK